MAKWQKNLPANVGDRHKRCGLDPWVRKIPGGVNGNPLQYSCLKNCTDREASLATVQGIPKNWTWLSTLAYLTYNGVLISAVQQSDSGIHTHGFLFIFFSIIISRYNKYGKYGSPLLCIHPICDSLHLLTPNSQSISSLPPVLWQL